MRRLALPLLLLALCGPTLARAAAPQPPVTEVVAKMQAFYAKTKDLKSAFKQVYTDTLYNRKRTSYGYLYVKKPGMMRWNYVQPEKKAFIADGKELWVWEPEDRQAFRNPLNTQNLSTGLTFLLGTGDLLKEFRVAYATDKAELLGGPDDLVVKLTPRKPTAQYTHLVLALRPADFAVVESMVVSKHSQNHFVFTKMEVNTRVQKSRFAFAPPPGTKVVDGAKIKR
ncbi:MAG: outer membrane lipoprotein carrier protein LolA [Deltaproteobacteria bacterium]|nr:outer membrane lipoprotein carrier protein LolA [Deltaproteobacteria bacterium]